LKREVETTITNYCLEIKFLILPFFLIIEKDIIVQMEKIFVNFINYCDISYMPENIYKNCPKIDIDGYYYTHPHFMLVDAYRVYSDPMTSYFRLTKTFTRFNKLMHYYCKIIVIIIYK
jgi:hypothetical protein